MDTPSVLELTFTIPAAERLLGGGRELFVEVSGATTQRRRPIEVAAYNRFEQWDQFNWAEGARPVSVAGENRLVFFAGKALWADGTCASEARARSTASSSSSAERWSR